MSITAPELAATSPADDAYQAGFLDGELDAISKLPAALATARASMAEPHNPMWAQGYDDGFIHATTINALDRENSLR
ncbi:hypothetical protein [Streptomyces griseorubiginosus]|uniref:hypothetical protein n=1 Tax=Streptomyces griseorubiginosus TaxID=67304 RepID=UPI0033D1F9E2